MKSVLTLLAFLLCSIGAQAVTTTEAWSTQLDQHPELAAVAPSLTKFSADDFLALTPSKVRELSGKKLGIAGTLALKQAQKSVRKNLARGGSATDLPKGAYIVFAIFGLGWLAMGLMDDFEGNNWWVNLLLTLFCVWIGGLIHALIKMKEYY